MGKSVDAGEGLAADVTRCEWGHKPQWKRSPARSRAAVSMKRWISEVIVQRNGVAGFVSSTLAPILLLLSSSTRPIAILSLVTATFIGSVSRAQENEGCVYPETILSLLTPPERQLGDYRLELAPLDFSNHASIREHHKYSRILGFLLKDSLTRTTRGLCDVSTNSAYYPDLHVSLTRKSTSGSLDSDRSDCLVALLGSVRELQPRETEIKNAAKQVIESTVHWLAPTSPTIEAYSAAFESLGHIYQARTAMNAFVSVRPSDISSVDVHGFLSWLNRQNAQRREALIPSRRCTGQAGERTSSTSARQLQLRSSVAPPGIIKIALDRSNIDSRRPLRRLVMLGMTEGFTVEDALKVCENKTITIKPVDNSSLDNTKTISVQCIHLSPANVDWWVGFYCDPLHCQSEAEEKVVMEELMKSLETPQGVSTRGQIAARGPYLIEMEMQSK